MVGAVDYGARGLDPSPNWNHYVVFSVMAHPSRGDSLHPDKTGKMNAGVALQWTGIPCRGNRNTPSRSCYRNRVKPGLNRPLA